MLFKQHSELEGRHAFLSPSKYAWLNYDLAKLETRLTSWMAARRGTELHALAHNAIKLGVPLHHSNNALAAYVADAIAMNMTCEQHLYYSDNCFGSADTIAFVDGVLHIHDLKTGITRTKMEQLKVYAALFCLEYGIDPFSITIELRIYQRKVKEILIAEPENIASIMDKIVRFDHHINELLGVN
jgi:hypothetical protein